MAKLLSVLTILTLPSLSGVGTLSTFAAREGEPNLQQLTFTPRITPIQFTVSPEATPIDNLEPLPSPTADEQSEEEDVELELGGGDGEDGYDFVKTEDGAQWHIWHNGEVLIAESTDLELIARLGAFRERVVIRARAIKGQ